MRRSITPKPSNLPVCEDCGVSLETAATAQNSSATIRENSLARCPSCLVLVWVGADLRPSPEYLDDEAAFDAAINANPEIKEWAMKTLETSRIRAATEIKAECVVAREWLIARGSPGLLDDLAALDEWAASFDEKGFTCAPFAIRFIGSGILTQMRSQTRH
jgi:hypothetical protein